LLLYGDLGERHVVDSFAKALRDAGHEVALLPSLVTSTGALDRDRGREAERERAIDDASPADVLFVFRVDELTPRLLARAREQGLTTIGWFCDDPLYYEVTYRHVVGSYDLTLHTGRADLLAYYEERHGARGYAFPYWTDDIHYPYVYDPDGSDVEIGFVGSFGGHARRMWRYDLLASLPFDVRFYGPMPSGVEDYAAMGLGVLPHDEIPRMLRRFRLGLSLAQTFDEGGSDRWSFPDLARFREYYFPSRIVAYAAAGVPTLTLQRPGTQSPLASITSVSSRAELVEAARGLLSDRRSLINVSRAMSDEFEACLTARSRVAMLDALLAGSREHPLEDRAEMWRDFGTKKVPRPGVVAPVEPGLPRHAVLAAAAEVRPVDRASSLSIVLVGRGERIERALARGARALGHDVATVDVDSTSARGYGPVVSPATDRTAERTPPDVAVYVDGVAPSERSAAALRAAGTSLVCLRFSDPAFVHDTTSYLDRFDVVTTTSDRAARRYSDKGAGVVVVEPGAEALNEAALPGLAFAGGHTPASIAIGSRLDGSREIPAGSPIEAILPDGAAGGAEALAALAAGVVPVAPADATGGLVADRELLAYRNPAELLGLVGYYARRPEETEPIRRAGFARVVSERSWSDRWPRIVMGMTPRTAEPRVVVLGYYGMRNLGDELILEVIASRLGGARMQVIGYGPGAVAADHALAGAHVLDADATEGLVRDADLLVIGSGGVLHDRELAAGASLDAVFDDPGAAGIAGVLARNAALATAAGTPVALLAIGAGPVSSDAGRSVARFLTEHAVSASVRDDASAEMLRASGATRDVSVAADPTLLVERPSPGPARAWLAEHGVEGDYITVAMRRWNEAPADLDTALAAVLDELVEQARVRVVFVPFQRHAQGRRDEAANRAISEHMRRGDAVVHAEVDDRGTVLGVVAGARAGIAMRLHASILANSFGVPTVGLAYDPKVTAHYAELGRAHLALSLDFKPQTAFDLVKDLLELRDEHSGAIAGPIAAMRERAGRAFDALAPVVRVDTGRTRRSRAEREASLDEIRRELRSG
jgi:polysaccharide pyruvyl transferase WcaK-like protein